MPRSGAGDFDRMSAVWADGQYAEAVSCVHPGWTMLRGRESVLRSWALIMANTSYIQFVLTDVETDVYGDHAVVTCKENILTADEDTETGFLAGEASSRRTCSYGRTANGGFCCTMVLPFSTSWMQRKNDDSRPHRAARAPGQGAARLPAR